MTPITAAVTDSHALALNGVHRLGPWDGSMLGISTGITINAASARLPCHRNHQAIPYEGGCAR